MHFWRHYCKLFAEGGRKKFDFELLVFLENIVKALLGAVKVVLEI